MFRQRRIFPKRRGWGGAFCCTTNVFPHFGCHVTSWESPCLFLLFNRDFNGFSIRNALAQMIENSKMVGKRCVGQTWSKTVAFVQKPCKHHSQSLSFLMWHAWLPGHSDHQRQYLASDHTLGLRGGFTTGFTAVGMFNGLLLLRIGPLNGQVFCNKTPGTPHWALACDSIGAGVDRISRCQRGGLCSKFWESLPTSKKNQRDEHHTKTSWKK